MFGAIGAGLTISVAAVLLVVVTLLVAVARKRRPLSPVASGPTVHVAAVLVPLPGGSVRTQLGATESDVKLFGSLAVADCQSMRGNGVPVAVTVKLAVWPATTAMLAGCKVKLGATGACVTVSVAGLELTQRVGAAHTTTWNCAPLSVSAVVARINVAAVASAIGAKAALASGRRDH
jgi:hypothetical protein